MAKDKLKLKGFLKNDPCSRFQVVSTIMMMTLSHRYPQI